MPVGCNCQQWPCLQFWFHSCNWLRLNQWGNSQYHAGTNCMPTIQICAHCLATTEYGCSILPALTHCYRIFGSLLSHTHSMTAPTLLPNKQGHPRVALFQCLAGSHLSTCDCTLAIHVPAWAWEIISIRGKHLSPNLFPLLCVGCAGGCETLRWGIRSPGLRKWASLPTRNI